MRAKYASAIRKGILAGKQTRYGDIDDPYYELRSDIIWNFGFGAESSRLRELSLEAFEKTWQRVSNERMKEKSNAELSVARKNFRKAHELWTESREERQIRLLREELRDVKQRIRALENA